jgi:hypothetical protein
LKRFVIKWVLVAAVNNKGAVSPVAREIANTTPVINPVFPVATTTLNMVFHRGIPRAMEASLRETGTSLSDSSVVLAIIGIMIKLNATAPAKAEKCLVLNTSMMKTNKPMTMEGKPVSTSFMKLETVDNLEEDHSEKNMPAPTPIGMEIRIAKPTMVNVPAIVLEIPPPDNRGPVGRLVKKAMLIAGAPWMKMSAKMNMRGITAKATATIRRMDIIRLIIFRQGEMLVGKSVFFNLKPPKPSYPESSSKAKAGQTR